MIRNYLKIALRNLLKYRFISFIKLFGLTVGLSCCLLILAYVLHELSYDRYHSNADNIYRVERTFVDMETGLPYFELGAIAAPFIPLLENDFEEVRKVTSLLSNGTTTLHYEEKIFNEEDVYLADEHLFSVFDVELLQGNAERALQDPFTVILTEELARKYFGEEDPLNQVIRLDGRANFKVTGVFKAFPSHSHVHPQVLLSFNTLKNPEIMGEEALYSDWSANNFFTYLLLPDNYDPVTLEAQFPDFLDRHLSSASGTTKPSQWNSLSLRALTDIHLHSHRGSELEKNGDIQRVYIFSAIALFILLIACINYMNLATARSVLRAREIGVRKVIGAGKGELIAQFLSESVLISWIAAVLAFVLTWGAFPWLNQVSGLNIPIDILLRWEVLLPLLLLPFVVGVLSGMYPALFLSSFQPVKVLKGFTKIGGGVINFRQALVVVQFSISIILIVSTLVVYQQLQYIQEKALGYDREHIVTFGNTEAIRGSFEAFRNELVSSSHVKEVGRSSRIPTGRLMDGQGAWINRGDSLEPAKANIRYVLADDHFMSTYGIKLLAGRMFSTDFGMDTSAFILNETAVRELGLKSPEEAIGREFRYGSRRGRLIGVTSDFHFESVHQQIRPLVLYKALSPHRYSRISVKVSGENMPATLAHLQKTYSSFTPDIPFEYSFLEEEYARLYESERRQGTLFTLFACIAISIACLGLFGLSAFTISQRFKEIGIRKVLGAETSTIVALLSKDFIKLVVLATLIAFPLAWYAMHQWLQDFAYRIDMPLWVFLAAGVIASLIAFLTISFQAIKAATSNPVKNLRTE